MHAKTITLQKNIKALKTLKKKGTQGSNIYDKSQHCVI